MHLTNLELENFRSHAAAALTLGNLTILAGPKGAGKSSFLAALAACLLGKNYLTDGRGTGLDDQVMLGASGWTVAATMVNGAGTRRVVRTKGPKDHSLLAIPEAPIGLAAQQQALLSWLNVRADHLAALLDLRSLFSRSAEDLRTELLAVIKPVDAAIPIPLELRAPLKDILHVEAIESLNVVKALYDRAFDLRTDTRKQSKALVVPPCPAEDGYPDPAKVAAALAGYRTELAKLVDRSGRLQGAIATASTILQRPAVDIAALETELTELRGREIPEEVADTAGHEAELVRLQGEAGKFEQESSEKVVGLASIEVGAVQTVEVWRKQVSDATATVAVAEAIASAATERYQAVEPLEGRGTEACPICERHLGRVLLAKLIHNLTVERDRTEAILQIDVRNRSIALDRLAKADAELQDVRKRIGEHSAQAERQRQAFEARSRAYKEAVYEAGVRANQWHATDLSEHDQAIALLEQRIASEREVANRRGEIEQAEVDARAELPGIVAEIVLLEKRIEKAVAVLAEVEDLERQRKAYEPAHAQAVALDTRLNHLEALCAWLGPKGIRATLAAEWSAPFIAKMQEVLDGFGLGAISLDSDPSSFGWLLQRPGWGRPLPVLHLSEGQRLEFEYAYRVALAGMSGLGLMVLDGASALAGDASELFNDARRRGLQVIFTVTAKNLETFLINGPGGDIADAAYYWITNENNVSAVTRVG